MNKFIRVSHYAQLLGISPQAVRMKIRNGKLKSKTMGGIVHVEEPKPEEIKYKAI